MKIDYLLKRSSGPILLAAFLLTAVPETDAYSQFVQKQHRPVKKGEIPVSGPGCFDTAGKTYVLVSDISSPQSAVFLGRDVTLDLNGYTISFADAGYGHVPNYGFEEGLEGWDLSRAPGAKLENTEEVHAFIGNRILRRRKGDEIVSGYVYLPVEKRSYYAMCGVTGNYYSDMGGDLSRDMKVSIFVEDEQGNGIECLTEYSDSAMVSCPVISRSPRLGGGFVLAHLNNLPAGRYRIRVRAETDCLVDEIDIRPAMDAGIGIVGRTHPLGHNDHLYRGDHIAFYDYTADFASGRPRDRIPSVEGKGTVTIRNGTIRNAATGILSWGIQSTAENVKIILDNVRIVSSGINTVAADLGQAVISDCSFEIDNPFIINRHGSSFYAVDLTGKQPSQVSYCKFLGGQGCLSFKGDFSAVHHNHFINRQTVTNHYSIMAMGDSSLIFENTFEPEIGSGIEVYVHRGIEIFNNIFHISAAPPSCEYNTHLSTNAIRLADYGAEKGSPRGCYANRVYNNKFFIRGRKFRNHPGFVPVANAVFYSASGGDNEIFGNEIIVHQEDPETDAEAFAFYIGNSNGGSIYSNRIISNVTPVWVACSYGGAENTVFTGNIFQKAENTPAAAFPAVRMGSAEDSGCIAEGTEFRSNQFSGNSFSVDATGQPHSYAVYWKLQINLKDRNGRPLTDYEVVVADRQGREVSRRKSDKNGILMLELPEYTVNGPVKTDFSPYLIKAGKRKTETVLDRNRTIDLTVR